MKKIAFLFCALLVVLTFGGAGYYVVYTSGTGNAGYTIIPMIFLFICILYRINKDE